MSMVLARGFHHRGTFDLGPRRPLTRREKDATRDKIEIEGLQGKLTALHVRILRWIVGRVGYDGRCDPSHATIAQHTGSSVATVKRAIERARELGIMASTMRLIRVGARVLQRTSAYSFLGVGKKVEGLEVSVAQSEPVPRSLDSNSSLPATTLSEQRAAEMALAERRREMQSRLASGRCQNQ